MRYFEIAGGIRLPISEEEQELIEAYEHVGNIADSDLNERGQEVARKMVSRGLLNRLNQDGKIYYVPNGLPDIWRL